MWMLYWRLVGARIRGQMQYKISFLLNMISFTLLTTLDFAVIAILFGRFQSLAGWSIAEVALLYGLTTIAFSLSEMIGRGFDAPFEAMMMQGTFDRILSRPQGSFFQVLASEFQLRRLGRTLQGALVLGYALSRLDIAWSVPRLLLIPLSIASGTIIFMGLIVIGATLCFWTIKTPEVINAFTFGGTTLASFPLPIYHRWMRRIFLYIVPVAFVNYPTALLLLDRTDPLGLPPTVAWAAPVVALIFFGIARAFWQFGVSKYQSAGS
jgi:ABC-2 type transport system permease protein